jgi:hypothetical protein
VSTDFDFDRDVPGYYYELAFHDVTQRPLCLSKPRCITSEKAIQSHSDGVRYVNDTWNLQCFGLQYPQTLLFNKTADRGYLRGYVPLTVIPFLPKGIVSNLLFPDTIVDFKSGRILPRTSSPGLSIDTLFSSPSSLLSSQNTRVRVRGRKAAGWLLELQCVEAFGGVRFIGINFYSKVCVSVVITTQQCMLASCALG